MSPSLKPLIKGSDCKPNSLVPSFRVIVLTNTAPAMSAETSALYLASKSNYQHILDGTVLPGVTYPESLAENLSSKRTNHKLAEQGRRNRINTALKEIESLLPPWLAHGAAKDKDGKEKGNANGSSKSPDKPAATQPISKASTVEMAIVYIKSLKQQLVETQEKLKVAEQKLGEKNGATEPSGSDADANRLVESDKKSTATKPDATNSAEPETPEVTKSLESEQLTAK